MATKNKDDLGVAEVQKAVDVANEKGYVGVTTDPTPREAYTLSGVTSNDTAAKADASAGLRPVASDGGVETV